jgi:hypothetical protein
MGEISFNFPDQFQWGRNHLTFQTNSNGGEIIQLSRPIPMGEKSFNFPDQFQWGRNPSTFQTNSNGVDIIY